MGRPSKCPDELRARAVRMDAEVDAAAAAANQMPVATQDPGFDVLAELGLVEVVQM